VRRIALSLTITLVCACGLRPQPRPPQIPRAVGSLTLIGQYSIASGQRIPQIIGLPFGGISGLATRGGGTDLWGVSDAQQGGRIYQFAFEGLGTQLRVAPSQAVFLQGAPGRDRADDESMALLNDGTIVVCSEGTNAEPRLPPALTQYGRNGEFMRILPLRDRYVPEPAGPVTRGARGNAGFESVTLSPDGERLFAGVETALVQDGGPATFEAGAPARLLEYVPRDDTFAPAREFVYQLEPLSRPPFTPGSYINGLADLLALDRSTFIALERAFVQESGALGHGMNTIRLYRVSLDGATDVSSLDSLKGQTGIVPVTKTLLLDLGQVQGLSPELGPTLDNFEGLAFGPRLPDGRATLLMVSDDNFSDTQRTWFLAFAIQ
jgi:hypothetical protein